MSAELARTHQTETLTFTAEQRQILRDSFSNGASDAEFAALLEVSMQRGLNPFKREVFFVQRWSNEQHKMVWATQVSIDGLRLIAQRSGLYDGQDEPEFTENADGSLKSCRVRVFRKDWTRPAVGIAFWNEYVQTTKDKQSGQTRPNSMWSKMGRTMLAKCAEALAIRKAFPESAGGIYSDAEMMQAENERPTQIAKVRLEDQGTPQLPAGTAALDAFTTVLAGADNLGAIAAAWGPASAALSDEGTADQAADLVASWLADNGYRLAKQETQALLARNFPAPMLALLDALACQGAPSAVVTWTHDADIAAALGALPEHHAKVVKMVAARTWCVLAGIETTQPGRAFAKALEAAKPQPEAHAEEPVTDDPEREAIAGEAPAEADPFLEGIHARIAEIDLPGEAVAVWLKHRPELSTKPAPDREAVWVALCKRTEEVGKMKAGAAKTWLKRAIAEEDARRTEAAA